MLTSLLIAATAWSSAPHAAFSSALRSRAAPAVANARETDIEAALATLQEAGLTSETLALVRAEVFDAPASGRIVAAQATLGKAILTSIFGESKNDRERREAEQVEEDRWRQSTRVPSASEELAPVQAAPEVAPPAAVASAGPEVAQPVPEVAQQKTGPKTRPSGMSAEAAAAFPASARRGVWLEERIAALSESANKFGSSGANARLREAQNELQRVLQSAATTEERAEMQRRDDERKAKEKAATDLATALRAVEFGQVGGTTNERQQLRRAIETARTLGIAQSDVEQAELCEAQAASKAEDEQATERAAAERAAERAAVERAKAEKEAAAKAAARAIVEAAQAEKAAKEREQRQMELELADAFQRLKDSVRYSGPERKALLRELQIKWHPDKRYATPDFRERADELNVKINEAFAIAKRNAKARGESF